MDLQPLMDRRQVLERVHLQVKHLSKVLHHDEVWQQRAFLPEPARDVLMRQEQAIAGLDQKVAVVAAAVSALVEMIQTGESRHRDSPRSNASVDLAALQDELDQSVAGATLAADLIIVQINSLRAASGRPPLDGGVSPFN
ncbi:hypothetical protein GCM10008955_42030 [Deinococcus malanensis]|uniref:Uncharacterized protein n=1 Tax=Deinococcus malanensis TaxID=1706855 RepID=A0ABQ2F5R1_9DEIO|nr:hypothetical protein [Deinococcus malanensis]GGK43853.1 hypothetical protein GCM10008955_42030 [Deinococcus malanensis]